MADNIEITEDQITKAAESLKQLRPAYGAILDFYKQIFIVQEDAKNKLQIDPIQISDEMLAIKANEEFPLVNLSEFVIDTKASKMLLIKICSIIKASSGDMASSARAILEAIDTEEFDFDSLFVGLLEEDDFVFEKTAKKHNIKKSDLAFIVYNSIKSSLSICAQQLSTYLDKDQPWTKGYCPICGSPPVLSMFEGDGGERFLLCSFCGYKWSSRRLYCPFCDNTDSKTLNYLYSDEEKEYRADLCDKCKKYIKTIDTRKTERIIYPPFEHIATLHLDIKAKEMEFESSINFTL